MCKVIWTHVTVIQLRIPLIPNDFEILCDFIITVAYMANLICTTLGLPLKLIHFTYVSA